MKRLFLSTVIVLFTLTCAFSQQRSVTTYAACKGKYVESTSSWQWSDHQKTVVKITFDDGLVFVNDKANSVYSLVEQTTNKKTEEFETYAWRSLDESDKPCILTLYFFNNARTMQMTVQYGTYAYRYYIRNN